MSGHSKWSTIKRAKGAADVKRGQTFTKISNAIFISAKLGGSGDPNSNPRLRTVLDDAKKVNMPKENIERAIDKGLGKLPGQVLEEVTYEGFGPGKTAFFLEGITDNKLRTNQEIRTIFERSGGVLGGQGSTAYMFNKKGEIKVKSKKARQPDGQAKGKSKDEEILELIDLGAGDIEDYEEDGVQKYLVYTEVTQLNTMSTKITQSGFEVEETEIIYKANILNEIKDEQTADKTIEFTKKLEEHDDIHKVYTNLDIDKELM